MSTGRHHGFESLEEQRFLLALDFAGGEAVPRSVNRSAVPFDTIGAQPDLTVPALDRLPAALGG